MVGMMPNLATATTKEASIIQLYSTSEFETTLAFNSQGLRSSEEALQAPEIIFLGDSVTMGTGVEKNETFAHLVTK